MAAALTLLLIGCLLQSALCGQFGVTVPQTVKVLRGSCVTIPCSFDITVQYESNLDNTCKAIWKIDENSVVFDSITPQQTSIKGELTGDLTKKDCTTTLNNMQPEHSNEYFFRLECNNSLKYNFITQKSEISVTDDPPTLTLTPSTLEVREGTSVNLTCSAPAPCLSHPPNLTWTPILGDIHETLQENQDKAKVKTSVLSFTASHLHHRQNISCTAVYNKADGSTGSSVSPRLTGDISFAPQILPSSDCTKTKTAGQLNCSCETIGNPPPTLQWYLDGLHVNHSDKIAISNEFLNDTSLRSFITLSQPNLATLLCRSSNSLGSATRRFYVYILQLQTSAEDPVMLTVFITTVATLLVLVCALLAVIRAQKTHHNLPKSTAAMNQLVTSGEENEVANATEEDIYVNTTLLRQGDVAHVETISEPNSTYLPSSGPNNAEGTRKSSEKNNEEGSNLIYSSVKWKLKKKESENSVDMHQPRSSYLGGRCMVRAPCRDFVSNTLEMGTLYGDVQPRNVKKKVECEYANVKFKNQSTVHN